MTSWVRIAVGAAIGALIALLAHPRSRPFILLDFTQIGPSGTLAKHRLLPQNLTVLPSPDDIQAAGLWMQVGAQRLDEREIVSPATLRSLVSVADAASEAEPDNAFWPQMSASFTLRLGDRRGATERWLLASKQAVWNDHQTGRLVEVRNAIWNESGSKMAWASGRLIFERREAATKEIARTARVLLSSAPVGSREGLELRFATVENGRLLRLGSRSVSIGLVGVNMIDAATLVTKDLGESTPRKLLVARYGLIDALRDAGMKDQSERAARAFNENEGWYVLTEQGNIQVETQRMAIEAVVAAIAPGSFLVASALGLAMFGMSFIFRRFPQIDFLVRTPAAQIIGVVLAIVLYATTELHLLAVATVLCFAFLGFGPLHSRTKPTTELGPLFNFTIGVIGIVILILIGAFWGSYTTPVLEVFSSFDSPISQFIGTSVFLGLAGIVMLMALLVAPSWAIVFRLPTPFVFVQTLRRLGLFLTFTGILATVIVTPIAVLLDTNLAEPLNNILQNEPNFYLTRWAP